MDEIVPGPDSFMPTPEQVRQLQSQMLQLPQVALQTSHLVQGGICARTIFIPAGTALTGAQLNKDNICIMSGDITVTTDDGPLRLTGFHVIPAMSGFKRVGLAHADTYWTTLFPTELTDIAAIETEMTDEADNLQTRKAGIGYQDAARLEGE